MTVLTFNKMKRSLNRLFISIKILNRFMLILNVKITLNTPMNRWNLTFDVLICWIPSNSILTGFNLLFIHVRERKNSIITWKFIINSGSNVFVVSSRWSVICHKSSRLTIWEVREVWIIFINLFKTIWICIFINKSIK